MCSQEDAIRTEVMQRCAEALVRRSRCARAGLRCPWGRLVLPSQAEAVKTKAKQEVKQKEEELQQLQAEHALQSDKLAEEVRSLQQQVAARDDALEGVSREWTIFDAGYQNTEKQVRRLKV